MDDDLRELERAAQTNDPGARARLLAALRRVGRLDEERLTLAASLGDPDARALLGAVAPPDDGVLNWLESVREQPWALEVALLAAVVAARAALPAFEREHPEDRGPRRCVEAAEAVVACPCADHAEQAWSAGEWQHRAWSARSRRMSHLPQSDGSRAEGAAILAAQAAGLHQSPGRARMSAVIAIQTAANAAHPQVRDASRAALVRWLLGV